MTQNRICLSVLVTSQYTQFIFMGGATAWATQKFGRVGHNAFGPPKIFTLLLCQNKERSRYINRSKQKRHVMNELQIFREQFDVMFDNAIINAQQLDLEEMQYPEDAVCQLESSRVLESNINLQMFVQ